MLTPEQLKKRREERTNVGVLNGSAMADAMVRQYVDSGRLARDRQSEGLKDTLENQLFRCKTRIGKA